MPRKGASALEVHEWLDALRQYQAWACANSAPKCPFLRLRDYLERGALRAKTSLERGFSRRRSWGPYLVAFVALLGLATLPLRRNLAVVIALFIALLITLMGGCASALDLDLVLGG